MRPVERNHERIWQKRNAIPNHNNESLMELSNRDLRKCKRLPEREREGVEMRGVVLLHSWPLQIWISNLCALFCDKSRTWRIRKLAKWKIRYFDAIKRSFWFYSTMRLTIFFGGKVCQTLISWLEINSSDNRSDSWCIHTHHHLPPRVLIWFSAADQRNEPKRFKLNVKWNFVCASQTTTEN